MLMLLLQIIQLLHLISNNVIQRLSSICTFLWCYSDLYTAPVCSNSLETKWGRLQCLQYPKFFPESNVLLNNDGFFLLTQGLLEVMSMFANMVCWLAVSTWFWNSLLYPNLLYCIYVEDLFYVFFVITKTSFTQLQRLCSFIVQQLTICDLCLYSWCFCFLVLILLGDLCVSQVSFASRHPLQPVIVLEDI